jgi:hypothetical protein
MDMPLSSDLPRAFGSLFSALPFLFSAFTISDFSIRPVVPFQLSLSRRGFAQADAFSSSAI